MIKQTGEYLDYNDQKRFYEEYFHLTENELVNMQASSEFGLSHDMQEVLKSNDVKQFLDFITMLVHKSYGRKTQDGKRFDKTPEILQEFVNSAHYSDFMMSLIENDGAKGLEFVRGIMPQKLIDRAYAQSQGQKTEQPESKTYAPSAREQFAQLENERLAKENPQIMTPPSEFTPTPAPTPEPTVTPAEEVAASGMSIEEFKQFQEWKKSQQAPAPATPEFRVPAEDPQSSIGRPPHEQVGGAS